MNIEAWLIYVGAETLLCLVPGPAVLMVVSVGLTRGTRASVAANLGILSAHVVYFALSALGLGAVIVASRELFLAVRWVGVAFLVWLGLRTLLGSPTAFAAGHADAPGGHGLRLYRAGLLMKLADPKTLLYFVALLPQFVVPGASLPVQIAILAVTSIVIEFGVLAVYGALSGGLHRRAGGPTFAAWTNRISGAFLIAAGLGMAFVNRPD
jgi:threonine/homoserine/homoserine lactone efflux protein